ncbi:MAG: hypothetical protein NC548_31975 [Lachnospiraceae bacterium]|nr:hypothetical protein [Lachnospiraceae bacterium]
MPNETTGKKDLTYHMVSSNCTEVYSGMEMITEIEGVESSVYAEYTLIRKTDENDVRYDVITVLNHKYDMLLTIAPNVTTGLEGDLLDAVWNETGRRIAPLVMFVRDTFGPKTVDHRDYYYHRSIGMLTLEDVESRYFKKQSDLSWHAGVNHIGTRNAVMKFPVDTNRLKEIVIAANHAKVYYNMKFKE